MNKKSLLIAGAVATVGIVGTTGIGVASAATLPGEGTLVDKVVARLQSPSGESKAVSGDAKLARAAEHQQMIEEQLGQLVQEGKLTAEQKDKLLAKKAELEAERKAEFEAMKGKTKDEARILVTDRSEELKAWATANGIPEKFVELIAGGPMTGSSTSDAGSAHGSAQPSMNVEVHEAN